MSEVVRIDSPVTYAALSTEISTIICYEQGVFGQRQHHTGQPADGKTPRPQQLFSPTIILQLCWRKGSHCCEENVAKVCQ